MTPQALYAWEYDDRIFRKATLTAWQSHQERIQKLADRDDRSKPFVRLPLKPDTRKHPMMFTETMKRNLAACMTVSTYIP